MVTKLHVMHNLAKNPENTDGERSCDYEPAPVAGLDRPFKE